MSDVTPILPTTINGCDASGPTSARPKSPDVGQPYWDTDTATMVIWDGSEWTVLNCKCKCKDCDKCEGPIVPPVPVAPPAPAPEPAPTEEPAPNPPATPTISDMPTS